LSWLSGAFGYTFGVGGIWDWGLCGVPTPNPCNYRMGVGYRSYSDALNRGSSNELKHLGNLMRTYLNYNEQYMDTYEQTCGTTPSGQGCILNNPSQQEKKMVVARGSTFLLAYMPWNQTIKLSTFGISFNADLGWLFDPRDGSATTVRQGGVANYACDAPAGWCEWTNHQYVGNNPAASDRVFYISAPQVPEGFWAGESASNIQVLAASLKGGNRTAGPWGIIGQVLDEDGLPTGEPFYVWSQQGSVATQPAAARDGAGNFLVAWQVDADGDGWQEIHARWIDGAGEPLGDAFRASPEEERDQVTPSVAVDASGNAIVVWTTVDPNPGANFEIWGQSVDSTGSLVGGPHALLAGGGYDYSSPRIAASADGVFTLVWSRRDLASAEFTLTSLQLDSLLRPRSDETELSSGVGLLPWIGSVVVDAVGNARIAWEDRSEGNSRGRFSQRLDRGGRRVGAVEALWLPGHSR